MRDVVILSVVVCLISCPVSADFVPHRAHVGAERGDALARGEAASMPRLSLSLARIGTESASLLDARRLELLSRFEANHPRIGMLLAQDVRANAGFSSSPSSYFNYVLGLWSQNPALFDHLHPWLGSILARDVQLRSEGYPATLNGLFPNTPYWNYLRWRWSLNPTRFDHYHPRIGPLLEEDHRLRSQQPQQILPPPAGSSVPEPSGLALLLLGAGGLALPRAWRFCRRQALSKT